MPTYRFQALGPLPSGSGSRAYLGLAVLDETRAEPVVLVWVPEELARDVERSERIQRETERAALLDHPHIVRVYGFARMEEGLARVVEFADGEPLRRILDVTGPLPPALAARFIADAAQGVHYAHLAGNDDGTPLLHGDLRPETLLLSFTGHCKVSGYGAAAFAPKENRGRNLFVAPEQVLGGRAAMNVQTDVYLLGLSLYAALVGKAPFEDEADLEAAVLSKPIDVSLPEIPPGLGEIITRATAKKASDRFPSAQVFREAIELSMALPEHPEVAAWLGERFPDSDGARAARQRMIDSGIAGFARAQWEKQASAPPSQPPFPQVAPPPPPQDALEELVTAQEPSRAAESPRTPEPPRAPEAPRVPAPVAPPAPPNARLRAPSSERTEEEEAPRSTTSRPYAALVIGVLVLASAGIIWGLSRRTPAQQAYPPGLTTRQDAPKPDAERLDAGVASDAGQNTAAPVVDAGETVIPVKLTETEAEPDAGTEAPPAQAQAATARGVLSLLVEPSVSVEIDGKPHGKTPMRVALEPGRHRITFSNRTEGIQTTRTVTVGSGGVTEERVYLQKGFVSITAPPGAVVMIDGKNVGTAPLPGEVAVYEGSHKIEVRMSGARWKDAFTLKPNQRVYFDVGPQYE